MKGSKAAAANAGLAIKRSVKARTEKKAGERVEALRLARAVPDGDNEVQVREAAWQRGEIFPRSEQSESIAFGSGRYSS